MALHSLYCADVPLRNCSLTQHVTSTPSVCFLTSPQGFSLQTFLPMTFTATFVVPAQ